MSDVNIIVNREWHLALQHDSHLYECLQACGVEDWEGFADAIQMFEEECADEC